MQALGEHPAVSSEAVRVVFDVPKLQPSWSRLVLAGANLKLADRRVAQALRMRWVSLMLDLSESSQNFDMERKQLDRRDAAWLDRDCLYPGSGWIQDRTDPEPGWLNSFQPPGVTPGR